MPRPLDGFARTSGGSGTLPPVAKQRQTDRSSPVPERLEKSRGRFGDEKFLMPRRRAGSGTTITLERFVYLPVVPAKSFGGDSNIRDLAFHRTGATSGGGGPYYLTSRPAVAGRTEPGSRP